MKDFDGLALTFFRARRIALLYLSGCVSVGNTEVAEIKFRNDELGPRGVATEGQLQMRALEGKKNHPAAMAG